MNAMDGVMQNVLSIRLIKKKEEMQLELKTHDNSSESKKNQHNLKTILLYSNSNPIRNKNALGYGCHFCTEQFPDPKKLKTHFLQEHKIKELLKAINGRLFEYFVKLDITNLKCNICCKSIDKLGEFFRHIKTEHEIFVYEDFKSAIVPFSFDTDNLACVECFKEFQNFKNLLNHMNIHYSNYICPVCGRGFVTERLYARHVNRHGSEDIKCGDCDKVFGNKEKLRSHQKIVHLGDPKRNKCLICNERFLDYRQKVMHMVENHGAREPSLQCHICDKKYNDQRKLTKHVKKDHLLERNHKCQQCEMVFFCSTTLKIHMAKHTRLRQFKCDVCMKAYARKNTLREHMRIHANDRRFRCEQCGQAFVQKCSLRSHLRSKHGQVL